MHRHVRGGEHYACKYRVFRTARLKMRPYWHFVDRSLIIARKTRPYVGNYVSCHRLYGAGG